MLLKRWNARWIVRISATQDAAADGVGHLGSERSNSSPRCCRRVHSFGLGLRYEPTGRQGAVRIARSVSSSGANRGQRSSGVAPKKSCSRVQSQGPGQPLIFRTLVLASLVDVTAVEMMTGHHILPVLPAKAGSSYARDSAGNEDKQRLLDHPPSRVRQHFCGSEFRFIDLTDRRPPSITMVPGHERTRDGGEKYRGPGDFVGLAEEKAAERAVDPSAAPDVPRRLRDKTV